MSEVKIEKNVPMPPPSRPSLPKIPLADMEVGDCVTMTLDGDRDVDVAIATVRQRLHRFQKSNPPKKFSARKVDNETFRVFRMEDDEDHEQA